MLTLAYADVCWRMLTYADASAAAAVAPEQSASHSGDKVPLAGLAGFAGLVRRLTGEAVDTGIVEP